MSTFRTKDENFHLKMYTYVILKYAESRIFYASLMDAIRSFCCMATQAVLKFNFIYMDNQNI